MKNFLKLSLVAGLMMTSANAMAKDGDFSLFIGNVKEKTVTFDVKSADKVFITVYSAEDGELFSEKVEKNSNARKFYNFEIMPSGTYYLIAESSSKVETYKIHIDNDNNVAVEKTPVSETNKQLYSVR